ncbi:olfactory receptor 1019-like [Rhinatrema bivittatum]|uniref:olfactory receptor 1019-like n=1 Tax=Rhinatrema bivittatum TaxID=194408 RepID=UPI0011260E09|nr:olfactory receptor 1019-like [Rhinatrema bivittatum]
MNLFESTERKNQTILSEFILLGLSPDPELQTLFFVVFLVLYMITLLGNSAIMAIIRTDPQLHHPMYFFLSNLSFSDLCYSSVTVPKMLADFLEKEKTISFTGCMLQLHFFVLLLGSEGFILATMAYDRYVAICNPLHYSNIMTTNLCILLAAIAWTAAFLNSIIHTTLISQFSFCGSNVINHFSCDIPPLLQLSCSDTFTSIIAIFVTTFCFGISAFSITSMSYIGIISTVLKMRTSQGRQKAFSTCTSHLTVVLLFYVTALFRYTQPYKRYPLEEDRVIFVLYSMVCPMLNPFIYSLRNSQIKGAVRKVIGKMAK